MKATETNQPKEGSNKNEHFTDKLSVAHLPSLLYLNDFQDWKYGRPSLLTVKLNKPTYCIL